jgi:16S rRNA (uracil1498-N3)-methyltransferase
VNLILFEAAETAARLPKIDARARHILDVLRRTPGQTFDAGIVNGPRGKGTVLSIGEDALTLAFQWSHESPPLDPITLIVGLPRPQTARKILHEATTLGVSRIHFVRTARSEPSYAESNLWNEEWRRHLIAGAEQAFCTRLPEISHGRSLEEVLNFATGGIRISLDNYEASEALPGLIPANAAPITLAFGGERGWSPAERDTLRSHGFGFAHLGSRVLRVETAVVAAVAVVKAARGFRL